MEKLTMSDTVELKFTKPPLTEALLGVNFNLNPGFSGFLLGSFWSTLSDTFPNPALRVQADSGPRFRLVSANADRSLQILDTGIYLSWLKVPGGEMYPGFQSFFGEFRALYDTFLKYADASGLPRPIVTGASLGYTNSIEDTANLAEQFLPTVFPDFVWRRGHRQVPLPRMAELGLTC